MKKLFTFVIALFALLSVQLNAKTIYFEAGGSSLWDQGNAWFSAWVWGGTQTSAWYKATKGAQYYEINIPDDAEGMKFVRFSSVSTSESWTKAEGEVDGYWDQTGDIVISDGNLIIITGWGDADFQQSTYGDEPEIQTELNFALVGRINGDDDNEILKYEDGLKFTKESDFVYTLTTTFTGSIDKDGKLVQKVKIVDADNKIWARNDSKVVYPEGTADKDVHATMTKGQTNSSAYLVTTDYETVSYKITFTLDGTSKGKLSFKPVEGDDPIIDPDDPIVDPEVLEFALIGRLNGDNDNPIETFEEDLKFTKESDLIYSLNISFTGVVEGKDGEMVQKVKLIDSEGNIWGRDKSKQIFEGGGDNFATLSKGKDTSSAYLVTDVAVDYKLIFTLDEDKLNGRLTFEIAEQPTDIEETTSELIYVVDGTIIAPAPFAIIDLSGKDVTNANGSLQGTYIVKTQNSTAKISVQ